MNVYTIQFAVPATIKTGPEFIKWFKTVVDSSTFEALAAQVTEEQSGDNLTFYKRWIPQPGVVEIVKGFNTKTNAAASLKKTKELYSSAIAKPVFSTVSSKNDEELAKIESVAI